MMTTLELLSLLKERGIEVWADAGALRFSAPKGAMTAELKQQLTDRKAEPPKQVPSWIRLPLRVGKLPGPSAAQSPLVDPAIKVLTKCTTPTLARPPMPPGLGLWLFARVTLAMLITPLLWL